MITLLVIFVGLIALAVLLAAGIILSPMLIAIVVFFGIDLIVLIAIIKKIIGVFKKKKPEVVDNYNQDLGDE